MARGRHSLSVRSRIALAIFAVSTGMLVLMSTAVYVTFDRQLSESLDDTLRLRAESNLQLVDATGAAPALLVSLDPGRELATGEAVLRLYGGDGAMLADASPASETTVDERGVVAEVLAYGRSLYRTIDLDDDDYRVVVDPVLAGGTVIGVLVTGIERSRVAEPLAILRIILVAADVLTVAVLGMASYVIARRALRPVVAMTETAERITRGDLHERVGGAAVDDELGHLAATFNAMISRLNETIQRERRFTADASHELRTPLAAIEAGIDVTLAQQRDPAEYRRVLAVVRGQTNRIHELADHLLLLARLDNEAMRDQFGEVELSGLVEAAAQSFEARRPAATITIDRPAEPLVVLGDVELLGRAILNLMENAAAHVGPSVHVDITLDYDTHGLIRLVIEDDGPGIPEPLAFEVFQRFRRGDASRGGGGTGLGLAIVEAIARAHGGSVALAPPRPGRGARFELMLPPAT